MEGTDDRFTIRGWERRDFVDPEQRQRGIGRALVLHAVKEARTRGASRIDLTARASKQAARALYESVGFRERDTGLFRLLL